VLLLLLLIRRVLVLVLVLPMLVLVLPMLPMLALVLPMLKLQSWTICKQILSEVIVTNVLCVN
jgi:hypothetical protein